MNRIEEAILLLTTSGKRELTVKDAVGIIELVSNDPELIRKALEQAEEKGFLKRVKKTIYISEAVVSHARPSVRRVDCTSNCKRCGTNIKNCYYIDLEDRTLGPFGSECVQKIL